MDETDSDASAPLSVSPVLRRLKKLDLDHCRNDSTGQYETFFAYSGMKADMQRRVSAPAAISPATMSMPLNLARRNSGAEPMGTSSLRATTSTPPARSGRRPTVSNLADVPHELDLGGAGGDRAANSEHDDAQSLPTPSHLRRSAAPSFMRPGSCVPDEGDPDDEDDAFRRSRRHQSSAASEQRRCPKSIALRSCSALLSKTTRQTLLRPSRRHQSSAAEHYWRCRIALHPCTATTKTTLTTRRRASRRHRTFAAAQHRRLAIRSSMSKTTLMTACHRASRRRPDNAVDLLQWFAPRWTQIRQRRPDNAVDLLQ